LTPLICNNNSNLGITKSQKDTQELKLVKENENLGGGVGGRGEELNINKAAQHLIIALYLKGRFSLFFQKLRKVLWFFR
jgi:hypothetical protein